MTTAMRLITAGIALLVSTSVSLCRAQAPPVLWVQEAGGLQSFIGNSVALDSVGNVYVAGNQNAGCSGTRFCGGGQGFLAKYDTYGNIIWTTNVGGTVNGFLNVLCVRADGASNAYVAGTFFGRQTLGSVLIVSSNNYSGFIAKVDGTGKFLWVQVQQGGQAQGYSGTIFGNAIAVDAAGNCCVSGSFNGWANFGGVSLYANNNNIFTAKYAANGTFLWVQQAGSYIDSSEALGVAIDMADNVFVAGDFQQTAYWGSPFFAQTNLTAIGGQDSFLAKYDSSGNLLWVSSFGATNSDRQGNAVAIRGDGSAFVAGYDWALNAGFVGEYAPSGNALWTRLVTNAITQGIFVDSSNFVYVTGQLNGTANFGGTNLVSSGGGDDIFATKYDGGGNVQWVTTFGGIGPSGDGGEDVAATSLGEIYLTGYFDSAGFGDNTTDMFLLKLGFGGSLPGPALGVQMYPGITIDGLAGRLYQIQSTDSLQTTNWQTLTSLVLPYSPYIWVDTSPGNPAMRFYRAVLIQP